MNATLPWARSGHCTVSLGPAGVFLAGGRGSLGDMGSRTAVIFHPGSSNFTNIQDMPTVKKFASCAFLNNKVYVGGVRSADISVFDIANKIWQPSPTFNHKRQSLLSMFTIQKQIYFIFQNTVKQIFVLKDDVWTVVTEASIRNKNLHPIVLYKGILMCH